MQLHDARWSQLAQSELVSTIMPRPTETSSYTGALLRCVHWLTSGIKMCALVDLMLCISPGLVVCPEPWRNSKSPPIKHTPCLSPSQTVCRVCLEGAKSAVVQANTDGSHHCGDTCDHMRGLDPVIEQEFEAVHVSLGVRRVSDGWVNPSRLHAHGLLVSQCHETSVAVPGPESRTTHTWHESESGTQRPVNDGGVRMQVSVTGDKG